MTSLERFLSQFETDPKLRARVLHRRSEPAREAIHAALPVGISSALADVIPHEIYRHQREALDHIAEGRNVVIATETSSGKSLCFQLPVLSATMTDPRAHALFIFPMNALANDQENALRSLIDKLPVGARPRGPAKLHGGQGREKQRLAAEDPQIVLTNPEMVHLHLLWQHALWERFWRGLRFIVVDEMHLYRGAFGGHIAMLLRRVRRCAWKYGARPQVIAATATVGNPGQLAKELCATEFAVVDQATSARGPKTTLLWKPEDMEARSNAYAEDAIHIFKRALDARLQSILFARSRNQVEELVRRLEEISGSSRVALKVRAYRGGYNRDEREAIEQDLRTNSIRGVVTTNALEVGIDIGSLDVCVTAGYPGTLMALRQQIGRVGRRDRPSAAFLVASPNPLDAYLLSRPEQLAQAPSEIAVVARLNPNIVRAHVAAAAVEFPLPEAELERLGGEVARAAADSLVNEGSLEWVEGDGRRRLVGLRDVHGTVGLRSTTEQWKLIDPGGVIIGELDGASVPRMAHPGAVYLHQNRTFRVARLEGKQVFLAVAPRAASSRVLGTRSISKVHEQQRAQIAPGIVATLADVEVTDRYEEYLDIERGRKPEKRKINPPVGITRPTVGMTIQVEREALAKLSGSTSFNLAQALHGAEHLLNALAATIVLCDREDIEGHTSEEDASELVLFDRQHGGIGFVAAAFGQLSELIVRAGGAIDSCGCATGCPACVQSGRCLRNNADVSKSGARRLLRYLRGLPLTHEPDPPPRGPARVLQVQARPPTVIRRRAKLVDETVAAGDLVEHPSFGVGRITDVVGKRVHVVFTNGRSRILETKGLLKHVPPEP